MLTRSGWLLLVAAVATLVAARVFAVAELFMLGATMAVLPVLAVTWVRRRPPRLRVERSVRPRRVHLGDASRVELRATNVAERRSPVLTLHDPVEGTVGARLGLAPLPPGAVQETGYRLPTNRRGVVHIGPLRTEVSDPFGLARRWFPVSGQASLTVLPAVEVLAGMPSGAGRDEPLAGPIRRSVGAGSDDFATLRPYVIGDDLRRVHWPSTARTGDLLIRQDDERWQGHVTLVLDSRRDRNDAEGFEVTVSATASLVHAIGRAGDRVRLLGTDGTDSGLVDGRTRGDVLLERLAVATLHDGGAFPVVPNDGRAMTGTLIHLTGRAVAADLSALLAARTTFATVMVVTVDGTEAPLRRTRRERPEPAEPAMPPGLEAVPVLRDQPFAPAWQAALGRLAARTR